MSPPSPLAIATSSLQRLVKEEVSYEKELQVQETRLEKILAAKDDDENADYKLKQELPFKKPRMSSLLFANASKTPSKS
ncbi:hypothetical protein WAI453_013467 [Rhynchosporium graminicola]